MKGHERIVHSSLIAGKEVHITVDGGRLTSDVGVLMLADIERQLVIAERLASCIKNSRAYPYGEAACPVRPSPP